MEYFAVSLATTLVFHQTFKMILAAKLLITVYLFLLPIHDLNWCTINSEPHCVIFVSHTVSVLVVDLYFNMFSPTISTKKN